MNIKPNIISQNNSFKGHIIKPNRGRMTSYNLHGADSYAYDQLPPGATPNYEGAYPHEKTRIYKAAPFEIIPDEVYKHTDYTLRDDLWLNQIKKDYKHGYKNFASNANEELKFVNENLDFNKQKIEQCNQNIDKIRSEINDRNVEKNIMQIVDNQNRISEINKNNKIWEENKQKAQERFDVLKKVDDIAGEQQKNIKEQEWTEWEIESAQSGQYYKSKINETIHKAKSQKIEENKKIELISQKKSEDIVKRQIDIIKAKYEPIYEGFREKINFYINCMRQERFNIKEYKKRISELKAQRTQLDINMENAIAAVEKLYKSKYPHWL